MDQMDRAVLATLLIDILILCVIFGAPLLLCRRSEPLHTLERDAC